MTTSAQTITGTKTVSGKALHKGVRFDGWRPTGVRCITSTGGRVWEGWTVKVNHDTAGKVTSVTSWSWSSLRPGRKEDEHEWDVDSILFVVLILAAGHLPELVEVDFD